MTTTTYLPTIPELDLLGVYDRGIANKERIVLRVVSALDIGAYLIILGWRGKDSGQHVTPLPNSMYWFGSGSLQANDWLFLYTGQGTAEKMPPSDKHGNLFINYWGKDKTVFNSAEVVPVLWRMNGITIDRINP